MRDWTNFDHVGAIIEYENGDADDEQTLELLQYLVDTGLAWQLQGHYGRVATALIERDLIAKPTMTINELREQT